MKTSLLFVTAPDANFKTINRFLVYARDWENGGTNPGDSFHVILSKNDPEADKFRDTISNQLSQTKPGDVAAEGFHNEWAGASVKDIEKYVLDAGDTGNDGSSISLFLILDEEGIQDSTCIIAEEHTEWDYDKMQRIAKDKMEAKHDFNKVRVPWHETQTMWCNLDIGNMDWEDFVDEDKGPDEEGWWTFAGEWVVLDEEHAERRGKELRRLQDEEKI